MPIISWIASGMLKFIINYVRFLKAAVKLIGNGGFPSTHTTILSGTIMFIGLK